MKCRDRRSRLEAMVEDGDHDPQGLRKKLAQRVGDAGECLRDYAIATLDAGTALFRLPTYNRMQDESYPDHKTANRLGKVTGWIISSAEMCALGYAAFDISGKTQNDNMLMLMAAPIVTSVLDGLVYEHFHAAWEESSYNEDHAGFGAALRKEYDGVLRAWARVGGNVLGGIRDYVVSTIDASTMLVRMPSYVRAFQERYDVGEGYILGHLTGWLASTAGVMGLLFYTLDDASRHRGAVHWEYWAAIAVANVLDEFVYEPIVTALRHDDRSTRADLFRERVGVEYGKKLDDVIKLCKDFMGCMRDYVVSTVDASTMLPRTLSYARAFDKNCLEGGVGFILGHVSGWCVSFAELIGLAVITIDGSFGSRGPHWEYFSALAAANAIDWLVYEPLKRKWDSYGNDEDFALRARMMSYDILDPCLEGVVTAAKYAAGLFALPTLLRLEREHDTFNTTAHRAGQIAGLITWPAALAALYVLGFSDAHEMGVRWQYPAALVGPNVVSLLCERLVRVQGAGQDE